MSKQSDKGKKTHSDKRDPDQPDLSRRKALKIVGAGTLGAIGAVYGMNRFLAESPIDEATAMSRNIHRLPEDTPPVSSSQQIIQPGNNHKTIYPMKVVLINGSPRRNGNTFIALTEIAHTLEAERVDVSLIQLGSKPVQGCNNCQKCRSSQVCVFNDPLYAEVRKELEDADGLIIGSPVYYAGPNGALCALIDRVFYSAGSMLNYKVGAAVAVCRRGGASATLDRLNKYFSITQMNIVGSQYWNIAHGLAPGEVRQDEEGLQTMRTLARNMAWTIRNTRVTQQAIPQPEKRIITNFIR